MLGGGGGRHGPVDSMQDLLRCRLDPNSPEVVLTPIIIW